MAHKVSDFLKDRHPYRANTGFKQVGEREKLTLFDGYGRGSLEQNIQALQNPDISVDNKEKALKIIIGELMSAETKVRTLKYGIVQSLNWLIQKNLNSFVDELVCKAYRSLAVIPTCLLSIYRNNAIECILEVLSNRGKPHLDTQKLSQAETQQIWQAREAACEAIKMLCSSWNSRAILLGEEIPAGFSSLETEAAGVEEIDSCGDTIARKQLGRNVVQTLTDILTDFNQNKGVTLKLLTLTTRSLSHISSESAGLELCLVCGILKEIDALLRQFALQPDKWIGRGEEATHEAIMGEQIVEQSVTVVWNVCMDPIGKKTIPESMTTLPFCLGCVLLTSLQYKGQYLSLKAAVMGALSAIFIYEEAKSSAIDPLFNSPEEAQAMGIQQDTYTDIAELCVQLMREIMPLLQLMREGKAAEIDDNQTEEKNIENISAVAKNTVQCLRLISELPIARTRVSVLIGAERELCIMLFRGTPIEHEMMDSSGIT